MAGKIYLFDTQESHENLLPISFTRPVADIRVGIMTLKEKWEFELGKKCYFLPVDYLQEKYGKVENASEIGLFISGNLLPDEPIIEQILNLKESQALFVNGEFLAYCGTLEELKKKDFSRIESKINVRLLKYVYDIFLLNGDEIRKDILRVSKNRVSHPLPTYVRVVGDFADSKGNPQLFIEEGAEIECDSVNIKRGPVYIGKDTLLMEGAHIRGPLSICHNAKIRMGAKIYGKTTIGPFCKVGGEIDNSVFLGYSNKAHDGFLGNAVIGEWCNIGAGVNASNLKNDYSKIRIWNYKEKRFMKTDLQFCGVIMGDHSKIGINCMLNTATVIGVGVNIHGSGFPRVFLPNFCEGSPGTGFQTASLKKFHEIADRAMSRRQLHMDEKSRKIYETLYNRCLMEDASNAEGIDASGFSI